MLWKIDQSVPTNAPIASATRVAGGACPWPGVLARGRSILCLSALFLALGRFAVANLAAETAPPLSAYPGQIGLRVGQWAHRILVTEAAANGFELDRTGAATFVSDNPEVAAVSKEGRVVGKKPGEAHIECKFGNYSAVTTVKVAAAPEEKLTSFANEVLPALSKAGCNGGSCHSKPEGQGGFKLSVFAYDPKADHEAIVKSSRGRRIFPGSPSSSLLLLKPTMAVNHGGGQRFDKNSDFYKVLLRWITDGMPYQLANEPVLQSVQVYPHERRYQKKASQQLLVEALYSDGSRRDVTHLAEFRSNEKDVAQVGEQGLITVGTATGEGVVVVRFMGLVDISRVTAPAEKTLPDAVYASLPANNEIDRLVYARLKKLGFAPSDLCSDSEFLRRVSLDAAGVLPTAEEAKAFLADPDPKKRDDLVERMLNHPNYGNFWATKFADMIRPNPFRVGVKSVYLIDLWLRESFQANKPYDALVKELLTAQGSTHKYGPTVFFRDRRVPGDAGAFVSQIFLGVRVECAKCHHHPNEKWSQADYYQLASFFGEVKHKGQGISAPISGEPEFIYHTPGGEVRHPVSGEVMKPKALDGEFAKIKPGQDPREALAEWVINPANPYFSKAIANRIWAHFMGRGIVDPVDDFRASNPATNPELLEWLARDLADNGFNLKKLMADIMRSRVYQLGSLPNENNLADTRNYSRFYRRRLSAEVLLDAVSDLTGSGESFTGLPKGGKAMEIWNQRLESDFLDAFGRPNANADCPCERDAKTSVVQALHLMNSTGLQAKLSDSEGTAKQLASGKLSNDEIVSRIYLAAYNRPPVDEELKIARGIFPKQGEDRHAAVQDLMWALINSAEFVFNH